MIDELYIMHQSGAPRHFKALYYLKDQGFLNSIDSLEFDLLKQFAKSILTLSGAKSKRGFVNLKKMIHLFKARDQKVILGAAPFDPLMTLFSKLKRRHDLIYFTSWPFWDGRRYPISSIFGKKESQWHDFLDGVKAVAVTNKAKEAISDLGAKAVHIPHSVDTKIFHERNNETLTNGVNLKVLFVGRLVRAKGVDILLQIIQEGNWPNVEFWFVGRGGLEKEIRQLERANTQVKYFGYIDNDPGLAKVYRRSDIFVLPSRKSGVWEELFGIVLIEAMASGLPVISTNSVGPKEIVREEENGFLVPQSNKKELKNKLDKLIHSEELRRQMGQKSREIALKKYSLSKTGLKWKEVLSSSSI